MLENNEENVDETEKKVVEETNNTSKNTPEDTLKEVKTTQDAVEEIDNSIAVDAEKETTKEEASLVVDYSKLSLEILVATLKEILANNPVQKIKNQVESIKSAFNLKFGALLAEKKAAFLAEGGNAIDFQFSSSVKSDYNSLLSEYKKQRDAHYKDLDKQLSSNLEKRISVIEQLKDLIENADTATMYKSFRGLQDTWRAIGPVSKIIIMIPGKRFIIMLNVFMTYYI